MSKNILSLTLEETLHEKLANKAKKEGVSAEAYARRLIANNINTVSFNEGIKYDPYLDSLLDKSSEAIHLTRHEKSIIKLLIENKDKFTSLEELQEKVWKKKNASIHSIRNTILNIRRKTYREFILSRNNHGYKIDASKDD